MRQSASEDFLGMGEETSMENGRVERPVCLGAQKREGQGSCGQFFSYTLPPFAPYLGPAPTRIIKRAREGLNGTARRGREG